MELVAGYVDVHQHLWPQPLVEALRGRRTPPFMRDWTLYLDGEAPYLADPAAHDLAARQRVEESAGRVLLALSAGLGIHDLPPDDAAPLLQAWHTGVAEFPAPFAAWAAVTRTDPDLRGLRELFDAGFAGLEISANWLATPALLEQLAPTLEVCQDADRPVLVHPGRVRPESAALLADEALPSDQELPSWWAPVVSYSAQLQAAWWSWQAAGRALLPQLRICFVGCAGLAPVQRERYLARGGSATSIDRDAFVDTSSYGAQGLRAVIEAVGSDVMVFGSDRPYAEPAAVDFAEPLLRAITVANPLRLLDGPSARLSRSST